MKKNSVAAGLLAAVLALSLTGCADQAASQEEQTEDALVTADSAAPAATDATEQSSAPADPSAEPEQSSVSAYQELLLAIHDQPQDYYEMAEDADVEQCSFAICDLNGDGTDELLVLFDDSYTASSCTALWTLDEDQAVTRYATLGAWCDFYSNGSVVEYASHNQSYGDAVWPYTIRSYDADQGVYVDLGWGYSADKSVELDGNPYSDESDEDGDGVLYYLVLDGEGETPLTKADYDAKRESLLPAAQKIEPALRALTVENINDI